MGNGFYFGSTDIVYGADAQPLQFVRMTDEICGVCRTGVREIKMGVLRQDHFTQEVTLCCPNCGETQVKPGKSVKELPETQP